MKKFNALAIARKIAVFFGNRYVLFILFLCLYSQIFVALGGIVTAPQLLSQYLELPLLLYLFWYLNILVKPSRFQAFIAAAPLFLCYLGPDISFLFFNRVFRLRDLANVPELLQVMSSFYMVLAGGVVLVCCLPLIFSLSLKRLKMAILGALPIAALIVAVGVFPQSFVHLFQHCTWNNWFWSDTLAVVKNGRLAMLCYREAETRLTQEKTNSVYDRQAYDKQALNIAKWLKEKGNRRNVHLVIMESFVDPTLFQAVKYSQSPVHPDYEKIFAGQMGFSQSPVFGGGTAQAEFEALCGVPAYDEFGGGVEFKSFSGVAAWCLPGLLRLSGYRAIASSVQEPTFFNVATAYRGAGFSEQYYPKKYSPDTATYLTIDGIESEDGMMFDGDLFAQNREFIRTALAAKDHPPLFNYVLTIYGHMPYRIDFKKRPKIVEMTGENYNANLERVANQFWYRSQAVAEHVLELSKIDPESLIVIVSDHVPALAGRIYHKLPLNENKSGFINQAINTILNAIVGNHLPALVGPGNYHTLRYLNNEKDSIDMNRILIIDKGKVRQYKTIHHYDIPRLILDTLTDGEFCRSQPCSFAGSGQELDSDTRHQQYIRLMAHAIK
jgi:phosphoglycerol transferase MdoB-like AlkP superfamily enzyme